ncbi:MAG TPA: S-layer homology domain-containing protein [Thermoclostridium sp.]
MKILKKDFKWAGPLTPLDISKVTAVSVHHMEHVSAGMDEIHQWHLDRGWKGFAYNYWVDYHGNVWECRGLNKGAGLYDPLNESVISIGFQGDYDITKTMPEKQFYAGCELIRHLRTIIPSINEVAGHQKWQSTSCPGKYFPIKEMIELAEKITNIKDYDEISEWAKESVLNVVQAGIMIGDDEGRFRPTTPMTRQEVAVVADRLIKMLKQ